MTQAKTEWEDALGYYHEPYEDIRFLYDAIEQGNMAKHFRHFIEDCENQWDGEHKDLDHVKKRANFIEQDVQTFFLSFRDKYEIMVKDGAIPAPVSSMPQVGANVFHMDSDLNQRFQEEYGIDPAVFLSMYGTPSGVQIENDNPIADPNSYENPVGVDRSLPRRRRQFADKDFASANRDVKKKMTVTGTRDERKKKTQSPSFTNKEACRVLDAANAKRKNLSQEIACRRRNLDKDGVIKECQGNHLSLECPHAPKIHHLQALHPLHPLQNDSPIMSVEEWEEYTTGCSSYPGYESFDDSVKLAGDEALDMRVAVDKGDMSKPDEKGDAPSILTFDILTICFLVVLLMLSLCRSSFITGAESSSSPHPSAGRTTVDGCIFNAMVALGTVLSMGECNKCAGRNAPMMFIFGVAVNMLLVPVSGAAKCTQGEAYWETHSNEHVTSMSLPTVVCSLLCIIISMVVTAYYLRAKSVYDRKERQTRFLARWLFRDRRDHSLARRYSVEHLSLQGLERLCMFARKVDDYHVFCRRFSLGRLQDLTWLYSVRQWLWSMLDRGCDLVRFCSRAEACFYRHTARCTRKKIIRWKNELLDCGSPEKLISDAMQLLLMLAQPGFMIASLMILFNLSASASLPYAAAVSISDSGDEITLNWIDIGVTTLLLAVVVSACSSTKSSRRAECDADDSEADVVSVHTQTDVSSGNHEEEKEEFAYEHSYGSPVRRSRFTSEVNTSDVLVPRHTSLYDSQKSFAYNQRFWDRYLAAGGEENSKYDSLDGSHTHLMPHLLGQWCETLPIRMLPTCRLCKGKLRLISSTRPHSRGHLFYACQSCPQFFKFWASDFWAKMYRNYLNSESTPIGYRNYDTWVKDNDVESTAGSPDSSVHRSGTVRMNGVSRQLFLLSFLSIICPAEAALEIRLSRAPVDLGIYFMILLSVASLARKHIAWLQLQHQPQVSI
ncbi:MAG: hypothetical protein HOH16_04790 [Planctomycetaceae bacterium]|nr:hypothetical protein [Planctomycetaceae bacterium]